MLIKNLNDAALIDQHYQLVNRTTIAQHEILALDSRIDGLRTLGLRGMGEAHSLDKQRAMLNRRLDRMNARLMEVDFWMGERAAKNEDSPIVSYLTSYYRSIGLMDEEDCNA